MSDLQEVLQLLQTKHISGTAKEELEKKRHQRYDPFPEGSLYFLLFQR